MLDKIRLHQAGQLPAEYHSNFGLSAGLDGHLCGFLGVEFAAVCDRVRQGGTDDDVAEWCFQRGLRPSKTQIRIWNEFSRKFGWNDAAARFVERVKREDRVENRTEVATTFNLIELREGRDPRRAGPAFVASEQEFPATDITERKRAKALLAAEKRVLEVIVRGDALSPILNELCRLGEELTDGALVSILLVSADGRSLRHGAAPSLPKRYTMAIDGGLIGPRSGSCGTAAHRKETVIVSDIETDPLWTDYRHLALAEGLRACWSTPIFSAAREVLGTFALYCREPAGPTPEQQSIIEQFARLASIAIERTRAQEALHRSEAYLAEAQKLSLTGSFGWRVASGELIWSAETFCILGYDRSVKPSLELMFQRIHPEDIASVKQMLDRATRDETDLDFEHRLRMPDGTVKHVHVLARPAKNEVGALEFVGAVMDITERKRTAEALRASEHLARGQLDALRHTLDAIAQESDSDRLLEHVLRTIVEQTRAHSVSAWDRNEDGKWLDLIAVLENDRFQTRKDATHPAARIPMLAQAHPVWSGVLQTGQHAVMEDIDQESARMCVGSGADGVWHRVLEDTDPDMAMRLLKNHLRGLGVRTILFAPMLIAGQVAGIVAVRFQEKRVLRREEIELTRALAHQATLAVQLMRLSQQSRQSAVMAERNRMAREIHDTLAQGFTGIIMQLEAATGATTHGDLAEATKRIERASELARSSLGEARRSVRALRPHSLRNGKLFVSLDGLLKSMTDGTNLNAEFQAEGDERSIPTEFEEGLLRVTQEALTNAVKHASARNFRATLNVDESKVQLRLVDDGRGFDPRQEHEGFGLLGMKERVDQMGGQFVVRSIPGQGTEIQILLDNPNKA
jgi:PAS domain S-box-containing protein